MGSINILHHSFEYFKKFLEIINVILLGSGVVLTLVDTKGIDHLMTYVLGSSLAISLFLLLTRRKHNVE